MPSARDLNDHPQFRYVQFTSRLSGRIASCGLLLLALTCWIIGNASDNGAWSLAAQWAILASATAFLYLPQWLLRRHFPRC